MMTPKNLLIFMSDEHNPKVMGCAGNPVIHTPTLDALAQRGTRFTSAYTTCPICVPARASFATGKYVHQIGYWDNADAYDGAIPSWHHQLRDGGHEVVSIGKLHFRGTPGDDYGFTEEIVPMYIKNGIGDIKGLIRDDIPTRRTGDKMAKLAGPGESSYTIYDRTIAAHAQVWLHEAAKRTHCKPWVLFVSFVAPHFPLTAPPEWYYQYIDCDLPWPKQYGRDERPHHPYIDNYARVVDFDTHFVTGDNIQCALAGYYGLVSAMDEHMGHVLQALQQSGLAAATRILYTSDHGDNLGARGLWGKSTFYEESAGVPLILVGDDIPAGVARTAPVSHVDVYPFIFECVGESMPAGQGHPGVSLGALAGGALPNRAVLSEYHAATSVAGAYMLREGRYKYMHYVAYPPQLYDLESDPEELVDVAGDPVHAEPLQRCQKRLFAMLDPKQVDMQAKRRQAALLAHYGGRERALAHGDLGFTPVPNGLEENRPVGGRA
jgi:choline-sulfatase